MLFILFVVLSLGRSTTLKLFSITEELLLESCEIKLLNARSDLLLFLLLGFSAGRLQVDEI
jgi:hypothetical protein